MVPSGPFLLLCTQAAPPLESQPCEQWSRSQPGLMLECSHLLPKPDSILILVVRSSCTRGRLQKIPWETSLEACDECSGADPPGDPGVSRKPRKPRALQTSDPWTKTSALPAGPSGHACHSSSLRKCRDYYCFYLT